MQRRAARATELELRGILGPAVRARPGRRRRCGRWCSGSGWRLGVRGRLRVRCRRLSVLGLSERGLGRRSVGWWRCRRCVRRRLGVSRRGGRSRLWRRSDGRRRRDGSRGCGARRDRRRNGRGRQHGRRWNRGRRDDAGRSRRTRSLPWRRQLCAASEAELVVVLVFLAAVGADDHGSLTRSRRGRVADRRTDSRRGTAPAHP